MQGYGHMGGVGVVEVCVCVHACEVRGGVGVVKRGVGVVRRNHVIVGVLRHSSTHSTS